MTRLGADPDQLDALARSIEGEAHRIDAGLATVAHLLVELFWAGPAAEEFQILWQARHVPALFATSSRLHEVAHQVAHQADEQRRASDAYVGAVSGPTRGMSAVPGSVLDGFRRSSTPDEVRKRWNSLTPEQRAALLRDHPELLGNLDGIPANVRIQANHEIIEQLHRLHPHDPRLTNLLTKVRDPVTGKMVDQQVLLFDPDHGHIAVVWGDVGHADRVVIGIGGYGTKVDGSVLTGSADGGVHGGLDATRAASIYTEANRSGKGRTAYIQWLGYDAPQDASVALSAKAVGGGYALGGFVNGLGLAPDQELDIVAHSYGSVVAGHAITDGGVRPHNLVLLGSPGIDVQNVSDLHLATGSHVYVARGADDPIAGLGRFGADPSDPGFGATRLHVGGSGLIGGSHSSYFNTDNSITLGKAITDSHPRTDVLPSVGELVGDGLFPHEPLPGILPLPIATPDVGGIPRSLVATGTNVAVGAAEHVAEGLWKLVL